VRRLPALPREEVGPVDASVAIEVPRDRSDQRKHVERLIV
jgi:hypothetical protein